MNVSVANSVAQFPPTIAGVLALTDAEVGAPLGMLGKLVATAVGGTLERR